MREIKVRAWYKPYKQMCNVSMLQFDYDGTICAAVIIEKPFNDQRLAKIDDLIIEQFTGLKDKNGNEICVNDIVEMHYFEQYAGPGEVEKTVVGVVGKDSMGCFTRVGDKKCYWLYYLEDAEYYGDSECNEELELLGNIHENPELLEEHKK